MLMLLGFSFIMYVKDKFIRFEIHLKYSRTSMAPTP